MSDDIAEARRILELAGEREMAGQLAASRVYLEWARTHALIAIAQELRVQSNLDKQAFTTTDGVGQTTNDKSDHTQRPPGQRFKRLYIEELVEKLETECEQLRAALQAAQNWARKESYQSHDYAEGYPPKGTCTWCLASPAEEHWDVCPGEAVAAALAVNQE